MNPDTFRVHYFFIQLKLTMHKNSTEELVYGIQPVLELIESDKEIEKILVQKDSKNEKITEAVRLASARKIPVQKVPVWKFNKLTKKNHQGVVAYISPISYASLDHIISELYSEGKNPLILLLDRITDVRNFGAIARAAECAGVNALVIPSKGSALIGSDAIRTSAGALNHIPVCRATSLIGTMKFLKDSGLQVVSCTEKAQHTIYEVDFNVPTAIIMGSEEDGISDDLMQKSSVLASIPMKGKIGSLNVSVASGIILFEANRQRLLNL